MSVNPGKHSNRVAATFSVLALATMFVACGREQVDFSDIPTASFRRGADARGACGWFDAPALAPDPGDSPAGVPYPTPAAASVEPGITGIPLPPAATQVDGFYAAKPRAAVQVFEVSMSQDDVLAFFDDTMTEHGWMLTSLGVSPVGVRCEFLPHRPQGAALPPKNWIIVTTEYMPRPGEEPESGQPPSGFRGKGVPYAPRTPGKTTFSVLTPR